MVCTDELLSLCKAERSPTGQADGAGISRLSMAGNLGTSLDVGEEYRPSPWVPKPGRPHGLSFHAPAGEKREKMHTIIQYKPGYRYPETRSRDIRHRGGYCRYSTLGGSETVANELKLTPEAIDGTSRYYSTYISRVHAFHAPSMLLAPSPQKLRSGFFRVNENPPSPHRCIQRQHAEYLHNSNYPSRELPPRAAHDRFC